MRSFEKHLASLCILVAVVFCLLFSSTVSADSSPAGVFSLLHSPSEIFLTQSRFHENQQIRSEAIPYSIRYVDDPDSEIGTETVLQKGSYGKKEIRTTVLYYDNDEYTRSSQEHTLQDPVEKLISRGTKIIERTMLTDSGPLTYWQKLPHVWATSYDSTCAGCNETTATGMKQGYGVIAVDPTVIPLRSRVYIPGYGIAVAGDVGGLIKGNRVDLGYDSLNGQWTARYVDVYLLVDETAQ